MSAPGEGLQMGGPAYSQTGCSGLAPAPELCDSVCRNLALRAFANKPRQPTLAFIL